MLGLSRLGYAVLLLSTRLAVPAYVSLLEKSQCRIIVHMAEYLPTVEKIQNARSDIKAHLVLETDSFDSSPVPKNKIELNLDPSVAEGRIAYIMHSSGSTGLPKPIFQTHRACLENFENGYSLRALSTAPLFHTFGFASIFPHNFHAWNPVHV